MIGCSFVANRDYFGKLGLLDSGMDVYGGENIELGIRVCVTTFPLISFPSAWLHVAQNAKKKPFCAVYLISIFF